MSDINLNSTECLVHTTNFGEFIVTNICSGKITNVPWGTLDWLGAFGVGVLALLMIGIFVALLCMFFTDW
jgi:hypothetical protein